MLNRLLKRRDGRYMTLRELQDKTGIKKGTLYMAIHFGRLRAHKSGKVWVSTIADVEEAIEEGRLTPPESE